MEMKWSRLPDVWECGAISHTSTTTSRIMGTRRIHASLIIGVAGFA